MGAAPSLAGYVLQTVGLQYTTSSVSAFLTYLLVVFMPLIVAVRTRRLPPWATVAGVVLAVVGLALLSGGPDVRGRPGRALTLGCPGLRHPPARAGRRRPRYPVAALSAVSVRRGTVVLAVPALWPGATTSTAGAWAAAVYTGVAVTAVGLGLQAWGQRRVSATRAALLLLIEPVSATVLGFAVGERLGVARAAGALLILGGILVSELAVPVAPRPEDA